MRDVAKVIRRSDAVRRPLRLSVPDVRTRYRGCRVLRVPLAYPIFRLDYETERKKFEEGSGIEGLYSVGRNGEFGHYLMEDVYWRTRRRIKDLIQPTTKEPRTK